MTETQKTETPKRKKYSCSIISGFTFTAIGVVIGLLSSHNMETRIITEIHAMQKKTADDFKQLRTKSDKEISSILKNPEKSDEVKEKEIQQVFSSFSNSASEILNHNIEAKFPSSTKPSVNDKKNSKHPPLGIDMGKEPEFDSSGTINIGEEPIFDSSGTINIGEEPIFDSPGTINLDKNNK